MESLESLNSDDLAELGITISSPRALRSLLDRRSEVAAVRRALREGGVEPDDIRNYVGRLLGSLTRGVRFPHDVALSALAVALQDHPGDFAVEFLEDLSRTRVSELRASPLVADACLQERQVTPVTFGDLLIGSPRLRDAGDVLVRHDAPAAAIPTSDETHSIEAA